MVDLNLEFWFHRRVTKQTLLSCLIYLSKNVYKSDLNFMKGVAWDSVGAPQLESAKKAGELISDVSHLL